MFDDAWLVTWPDGTGFEAHGHGGVRCIVHVVDGELTETLRGRSAGGPDVRTVRHGDSVAAGPSAVHRLSNRSGTEVTTVHVCSPPLSAVTGADDRDPGRGGRRRTALALGGAVSGSRPAHRSSKGSHAMPYR